MTTSDLFQITFSDARYCCELGAALEQLVLTVVHCSQSPLADLEALLLLLQNRSLLFSVMGYSKPSLSTVATTPIALYCLPAGGESEEDTGMLVVNSAMTTECSLPVISANIKAPVLIALQHENGFITWEPLNASLLVEHERERLTVPLPAGLVQIVRDGNNQIGQVPTIPHDWELSHTPATWLQTVPFEDIAQIVNESEFSTLLPTSDFLKFLSPVLQVSGSRSYQPSRPALSSPVIFEFRLPPSSINANTRVSWAHSVVDKNRHLDEETLKNGLVEALHCLQGQYAKLLALRHVISIQTGCVLEATAIHWRGLPGGSYRLIAASVEVEHADRKLNEIVVRFGADAVVLKAQQPDELLCPTKRIRLFGLTCGKFKGL